MATTTMNIDYIMTMANNYEFDIDEVHISNKLFEHFNEIPSYSLPILLDILCVSKSAFIQFYKKIGYKNYTDLKEDFAFSKIIRKKQIMDRHRNFSLTKVLPIMEQLSGKSIDINEIDLVCQEINKSNKVIFYGSSTLLNKINDFQLDMKILGKDVQTSSTKNEKTIVPNNGDLICICSSTGRLFWSCEGVFQDKVVNSLNKKVLFSKEKLEIKGIDYNIYTNTFNDYYEMHYLYLFYLDLIKVRYYEIYVRGQQL
ncbi:MAG: hypothetical protein RR630_02405 [Coprobacillus sp.]